MSEIMKKHRLCISWNEGIISLREKGQWNDKYIYIIELGYRSIKKILDISDNHNILIFNIKVDKTNKYNDYDSSSTTILREIDNIWDNLKLDTTIISYLNNYSTIGKRKLMLEYGIIEKK